MKSVLKKPILSILKEIKITNILKQSNFVTQETGYTPHMVLLHFIYMPVLHKRQSQSRKQSKVAFKKNVYYRFLKQIRFNLRKLLLLSSSALITKIKKLHNTREPKLLIIDNTVEVKRIVKENKDIL